MTRVQVARCLSKMLRPVYSWRGRIVGRKFGGRVRFYDAAARRATERALNVFEMWEAKPGLDRMQALCDEADAAVARLTELRKKFGLDEPSPLAGDPPKEEAKDHG